MKSRYFLLAAGILAVVIIAVPFVYALFWPKEITIERIEEELVRDGFSVANQKMITPAQAGAIVQKRMTVNGAPTIIYCFDNEQKIKGLTVGLGKPSSNVWFARNDMHVVVVYGNDAVLAGRVLHIFESL